MEQEVTSKAEIEAGLSAHAKWKRRLREAVEAQISEFDPVTVSSDSACEFGKWLDSLPASDRRSEDYKQVKQLHSEFHKKAGEILQLAISGQTEKASAQLKFDGEYGQASGRLVLAMQRWQSHL